MYKALEPLLVLKDAYSPGFWLYDLTAALQSMDKVSHQKKRLHRKEQIDEKSSFYDLMNELNM